MLAPIEAMRQVIACFSAVTLDANAVTMVDIRLGAEVMADMAGRKIVKRARRGLLIQSTSVRLEGVEGVEAVLVMVEGVSLGKIGHVASGDEPCPG